MCYLSGMMKSHAILLLSSWEVNHSFVKCMPTIYTTLLLVCIVQYDTLRDHIHIIFTMAYLHDCSILLLVIVNLSLCLIYKSSFITGLHI